MKKIIFLFSLILLLVTCQEGQNKTASSDGEISMEELDINDMAIEPSFYKKEDNTASQEQKQTQPKKIIKIGYFTFETKSVDKTHQKINTWVQKHQGFIQNDKTRNEYNSIHRSLVIRVPNKSFNTLTDSIIKNAKTLDRRDISLKDVTEEFVDITARLKAKRKLEERYLQLLTKAKNVNDMLNIERQLANIREEIEAKQGRLKYLQSQVSLSTLHVEFYEITELKKAASQTYLSRLWRAVKGGFDGLGNFFIGLVYLWPYLLIASLVGLLINRFIKKRKSKP